MMKMKNSSKNLLNRINSKLGYFDKLDKYNTKTG